MSTIQVTDRRGGVYECVITFSYGECARLPFNALRKVNARIDQIRSGGLKATAQFNLRNTKEAANFVEVLDMFGEDGSFVHGSPADPEDLKKEVPEDDDESGLGVATVVNARGDYAAPSPAKRPAQRGENGVSVRSGKNVNKREQPREEADDLEIEDGVGVVASEDWRERADAAIAQSLAEHESHDETLARVVKIAGDRYSEKQVREHLIKILWEKFQDENYVAAFMKRRDWDGVSESEVRSVVEHR